MTPLEINTEARDLYNAVGDTFFTDLQIYNWMKQACDQFAKLWLIESSSSTSTVAATQSYAYPTNAIALKRVLVNGRKLKRITGREDDAVTLSNQTATTQGWPSYYTDWNSTIYLRPIPDAVYTLSFQTYNLHSTISAASTLDLPVLFHQDLVDYVLMRMFAKDKDVINMSYHRDLFFEHLKEAKAYQARKRRTDSFATTQSEENLPVTILGEA
jgi:hypothetical protein